MQVKPISKLTKLPLTAVKENCNGMLQRGLADNTRSTSVLLMRGANA